MRLASFIRVLGCGVLSFVLGLELLAQNALNPSALSTSRPYYYGYLFERALYPVQGARVRYADYAAIRRKHPQLQDLSEAQIDQLLLQNYAYVTKTQIEAREILFTPFELDRTRENRTAKVDIGSERAANLEFVLPDSSEPIGVYNGKGFGRMNVGGGQYPFTIFAEAIDILRGEDRDERLRQQLYEYFVRADMGLRLGKSKLNEDLKTDLPVDIRRYYELSLNKLLRTELLVQEIRDALAIEAPVPKEKIESILSKLRGQDYVNGAMTLDRALKEVVIQKSLQKILDQQAEALGRPVLSTAEIYFVIELPFQAIESDGSTKRLAILGREAGPRMDHQLPPPVFPEELMGSGMGDWQTNGFGRLLDFELYEVMDRRLPSFFRWNRHGVRHPIDSEMLRIHSLFDLGEDDAFEEFLAEQLAALDAPLPQTYSSLPESYVDPRLEKRVFAMIESSSRASWPDAYALLRELKQRTENWVLMFVLAQHLAPLFPEEIVSFVTKYLTWKQEDESLVFGIVQALAKSGHPAEAIEILIFMRQRQNASANLFGLVDRVLVSLAGCEFADGSILMGCLAKRQAEGDFFSFLYLMEKLLNDDESETLIAKTLEERIANSKTDAEKQQIVRITKHIIEELLASGISYEQIPLATLELASAEMQKEWDRLLKEPCTDAIKTAVQAGKKDD